MTPVPLPGSLATLREWVWGPGDAYPGIDELLVQFDPQRRPIYIAQDASGDVVAAFDLGGTALQSGGLNGAAFPGGGSGNPSIPESLFTARRVWQASYDPYGQVIAARTEHAHDPVWAGHKGLFVERLDAGVMDGLPGLPTGAGGGSGIDLPRLEPGSTLIANARNRWLLTRWGIWGSMDPNASGQGVIGIASHGQAPSGTSVQVDLGDLSADGVNLYRTYQSAPHQNYDPTGLFILPTPMEVGASAMAEVITQGINNHEWNIEWATDWSLPDDAYAGADPSWMVNAAVQGAYDSFEIGIPFTDISGNPLDLVFAAGGGSGVGKGSRFYARTMRTLVGVSQRVERIHAAGHYALVYKHGSDRFVKFSQGAIKRDVRIAPTGSRPNDISAANAKFGKPARYNWTAEFGEPHTWHHSHVRGKLELVPTQLHKRTAPHRGFVNW